MAIMGPFIENGINPHLLSEYDMKIEKAEKVRNVIKMNTQIGTFALNKTNISKLQAERMHHIVEFLRKNRFNVPKLIPNKYGEMFIPIEEGIVYFTEWIEGREMPLNHYQHFLMSISMMAHLHKLGFSYKPETSSSAFNDELYIKKEWENKIIWLRRYYKKLSNKKSMSTFEHIYQTYIPFLLDWSEEALENLNQWILEYNSINNLRKSISHGKFHHRNVIVNSEGDMYLIDFDRVSFNTPVRDLAYFIRHYILNKEHRGWVEEWIETYQKQVPLNIQEKKLLALLLMYPERLITLAKRYEHKQNQWTEEIYVKKLQIRWAQMKEMIWFIDQKQWLNK